MCLPVIMESMQTVEADHPYFSSVSVHVLGFCTFIFFLKNEFCTKNLILSCVYGLSVTVRHHLNSLEAARAVQMTEDGLSLRQVTHTLGVSPSVVNRLWARYLDVGGQGRVG